MDYTEALRLFWSMPSFEKARDERVTVPAAPEIYTDALQDQALTTFLGGMRIHAGQRIVDYGCGVGRVTRALLLRGARVVAVDVSPEMLNYCREYCTGLEGLDTELSDGFGCSSIPSGSIDGVVSLYCFQHMPTLDMIKSVVRDFHRILVPGGWFVLQFVDHGQDQIDGTVGFAGVRLEAKSLVSFADAAGFAILGIAQTGKAPNQYVAKFARRC